MIAKIGVFVALGAACLTWVPQALRSALPGSAEHTPSEFTAAELPCSCVGPASASDGRRTSTLVFTADVLSKVKYRVMQAGKDYKEYRIKVRVKRFWKGNPPRLMTIRTPAAREDCGYDFKNGHTYLVYAIGKTIPFVSFCTRTAPVNSVQARADLHHLGKGTPAEIMKDKPGIYVPGLH